MKKKLSEVVKIVKGDLFSHQKEIEITGISLDSRTIKKGDLFIALQGERVDGHNFLEIAFQNGAAAALIDKSKSFLYRDENYPLIAVNDTLEAFQEISKNHRDSFKVPVIAVTGSNGKTTTKDILGSLLEQKFKVVKTKGNYNNEIGLPLTLLDIDESTEIVVVEMAMRGLGQIKELSRIASPDIGIITNIGEVHYELLGSLENIANAKGELLEELPSGGTAILNWEDKWSKKISKKFTGTILKYGFNKDNTLWAEITKRKNYETHFKLNIGPEQENVCLPLPGEHNVLNALAASAAAKSVGLSIREIAWGLNKIKITSQRLELIKGPKNSVIINDSYNANPISMKASLDILANTDSERKIAVLGSMFELGKLEKVGHFGVGKKVSELTLDYLVTVGNLASEIAEGAKHGGMSEDKIRCFFNIEDAARFLLDILRDGDTVLLKGSRSMEMEKIVQILS